MLFLNSWRASSHIVRYDTVPHGQLFKSSIDTQGKFRLNIHSFSVSVSELLEYRRYSQIRTVNKTSVLCVLCKTK